MRGGYGEPDYVEQRGDGWLRTVTVLYLRVELGEKPELSIRRLSSLDGRKGVESQVVHDARYQNVQVKSGDVQFVVL